MLPINKMRCLVLGGNGFIGSQLVPSLLKQGYVITLFDHSNHQSFPPNQAIKIIKGDLSNPADVAKAMVGCDICFHLISTVVPESSNIDPIFDINNNLVGTINLLNQAVENGIKKIIFISSGGTVYGNPQELPISEEHPTNPLCSYGIIKLTIEKYLDLYFQLYQLDYIVLRVSNVFGFVSNSSTCSVINVFFERMRRDLPIHIWGDGTVVRDYIHVSDVITALIKSIFYTGSTKIFNIGSGSGLSLNEVVERMENLYRKKIHRIYSAGRKFDVIANILAIKRARCHLEWLPETTFIDGLLQLAPSL
jgi:UDP-glucose 4-epimerase